MDDKQIRWQHIKLERKGRRLFDVYCSLNGCCECCNKKVKIWCKVKERIALHQEKIITKLLDRRG